MEGACTLGLLQSWAQEALVLTPVRLPKTGDDVAPHSLNSTQPNLQLWGMTLGGDSPAFSATGQPLQ